MSQQEDDVKATAEDLIADAERLKQIERAKLELEEGDPRLVELAAESERIVRRMAPKVAAQSELASEANSA